MGTKRVTFSKELDDADEIPNSRLIKKNRMDEIDEFESNDMPECSEQREKKHTLDSDEEDDVDKYQIFDVEKFEGQEAATQEYDGKTKIMPFNMDEDMEEGHFDQNGTFIYNKKENIIKDAWLDNVNWDNVKNAAGNLWQKKEENADEDDAEEISTDAKAVYQSLLKLLSSKTETIAAALKRLNSEKGLSAAEERKQRWAAKKAGQVYKPESSKIVLELTSLVDSLISLGHMEAYQLNGEKIQELLKKMEVKENKDDAKTSNNEPFDMFGDEPVEKQEPSTSVNETVAEPDNLTMWEWRAKLENGEFEESINGPVTTSKICEMKDKGDFKHGAQVRKVGSETFYDIKRIDFDLYD